MNAKKSRKANLERLRFPLLLIGLTFSGALILSAFEWRSYDEVRVEHPNELVFNSELADEPIFIAVAEKKLVAKKKKVQKPVVNIIQIVANTQEPDLVLVMPDLGEEDEPVIEEIGWATEAPVEIEIFAVVEEMPSFPGGTEALFKYLGNHIQYPSMAKDAGVEGTVWVSFVVSKDGTLRDLGVIRKVGSGCDEEVLRVVKGMPDWTPGKQRGRAVDVSFNLPVTFTLN